MTAFKYLSVDKQGQQHQGTLEAESARQARDLLRNQGLLPIEIMALSTQQKSSALFFKKLRSGINAATLVVITRQLATLIQVGTPIDEALAVIANQLSSPKAISVLHQIRAHIQAGHTLASALAAHPDIFSELYCATIASGEQAGNLDHILTLLADYSEQQQTVKQKLQQALIYPALVTGIALMIVTFLLIFVVPKMVAVFIDSQQQLPLLTVILIKLSYAFQHDGIYFLLGFTALGFVLKHVLTKPEMRYRFHQCLLRQWGIGYLIKIVNLSRFMRNFAILAAAGVPIVEAIEIASKVVINLPIQQALRTASQGIREGQTIHKMLQQSGYFPPLCIYLIAGGENTDQLETMLDRAAAQLEGQFIRLINMLLTFFEPCIMLLMGMIVLFIVLAVLLPIFDLNQLVIN